MTKYIAIAVLILFGTVFAHAQVDTGEISGVVRDPSGAVIQQASVKVVNGATAAQLSLTTDANGFFSAPGLRPGQYEVSAGVAGFGTITQKGIVLRVQDRLAVDFTLTPSAQSTEITVEARTPQVESETSSLGHVVEGRTIQNLPLNGRNFIQLATLGAGTSPSRRGPERDTFVANGARPIQNSYLLDGVENKNKIVGFDNSSAQVIQPVLDGIQEFKVQTNTFSAEFGQAAGAVVNVTLKSGTNQIHGSAFEFLRNSALDAKPYFQPTSTRPQFIQNEFGATLGGPIIKNRTFAFFSWQSQREVNAAPQVVTVPTSAMLAGQFATPLFDPATTRPNPGGSGYIRDPFPGNVIPQARWDSTAAQLVSLYPAANQQGAANYFSNQRQRITNDQYNIRVDHKLTASNSLFARVSSSGTTNTLPAPMPLPANAPSIAEPIGKSYAASDTQILSANAINEARFGYLQTRLTQKIDEPRLFGQYGINGAPDDPTIRGLPTFAVVGLSTLGSVGPGNLPTPATGSGNFPIDKQGDVLQFSDNFSWVKNRHTLKFGGDFQQVNLYANSTLQARPAFNFNGVFTQDPQNRSGTGAPFADFLLGLSSVATVSTRSISESRQHIWQGYVQDDWTVNSRLTINAGVRYELAMPFYETANHYADVILEPGALYGSLITASEAGKYGYRKSFTNPDWNNFAPRLGFAYKLTPKTVVRSAFGIFYGRDENTPIARRPTNNPPFFVQKAYTTDQIHPLIQLDQGFPADALDPAQVTGPDVDSYRKSLPLPYVLQWHFDVQHELGGGVLVQATYVGSGSRKLYYPLNINLPEPGPGAINPRRPFPQYSGLYELDPAINASYQALQLQAERRFSHGFSMLAAYTYSHSIDDSGANQDLDTAPQNPRNLAANRGNSNFDIRHRLTVSYVYELPFGRGKQFLQDSWFGRTIAAGWELSGITVFQTGLPFTPVLSFDPTNTGTAAHPDRIGDGALPSNERGTQRWFDVGAFAAPAPFTYGNSGRNILRGPSQTNFDLSLSRSVRVRESASVEFRAEAFNLFNTPQFGLPAATIGAANAGIITSVVTPERQIQVALRFSF